MNFGLPEGEKDADLCHREGKVASTGWAGAGKWTAEQGEHFKGYAGIVYILVDNDATGYAEGVLKHDTLTSLVVRVQLLRPLNGYKDISDLHASIGGHLDDLDMKEIETEDLGAVAAGAIRDPARRREWMTYNLDAETMPTRSPTTQRLHSPVRGQRSLRRAA